MASTAAAYMAETLRQAVGCDTLLLLGTDFPYRPFYPESRHFLELLRRLQ